METVTDKSSFGFCIPWDDLWALYLSGDDCAVCGEATINWTAPSDPHAPGCWLEQIIKVGRRYEKLQAE